MSVPCVHRKTVERCVMCSGYVRFLDGRPNTAQRRRQFWEHGCPSVVEEAMAQTGWCIPPVRSPKSPRGRTGAMRVSEDALVGGAGYNTAVNRRPSFSSTSLSGGGLRFALGPGPNAPGPPGSTPLHHAGPPLADRGPAS